MLVTIQQTQSNFENLFEITRNGQVLFTAKAPWMKASLPFKAEHVRKLTFNSPSGETVYTTNYNIMSNLIEESIPFKYLSAEGQRFGQFEIIGQNGREGAFYTLQEGYFDHKFCIEYKGDVYLGYGIETGKTHVISIYAGEEQVAQITKPMVVIDNLDIYFMHLKDELESLIPILSFFTIYFDFRKYNNSGKISRGSVEISVSYSYDKNNSKYNPNWISQQFGRQTAEDLELTVARLREQARAKGKKYAKLIGIVFLILIVIFAVAAFVIFQIVLG